MFETIEIGMDFAQKKGERKQESATAASLEWHKLLLNEFIEHQ